MIRPTSFHYTTEHAQVVKNGQELQHLIGLTGWRIVDDFMSALVSKYQYETLNVPTNDSAAALDTLRQWQIADEVVSSIRDHIQSSIQDMKDLAPQDQLEESLLQERMNERFPGFGDPESDRSPEYS